MYKEDVIKMAEEYEKKTGYLPGALVISRSDVKKEFIELVSELTDGESRDEIIKKLEDDVNYAERLPVMGLAVVLSDKDEPPYVRRDSGKMSRIKPQGMGEAYMPVADITNSMSTMMRASLSFFDKIEGDDAFNKFAKECAEIIADRSEDHWEDMMLPKLDNACDDFSKDCEHSAEFFKRFFKCVMDFYWHCSKLVPASDTSKDRKLFDKIMGFSALIRTMPKDMREEYLDHLHSTGQIPEGL